MKQFYDSPLPNIDPADLNGWLFVLEGLAGAGCRTQSHYLSNQLEIEGYSVVECHLDESALVESELQQAWKENIIGARSLFLFRATDLYDRLEKIVVPALHAGNIVLADRYIFTLLAEARVRNLDAKWIRSVFGPALIPDAVFFLQIEEMEAAIRVLKRSQTLESRHSGLDSQSSGDLYQDFIQYQSRLRIEYSALAEEYSFTQIDARQSESQIAEAIKTKILKIIQS